MAMQIPAIAAADGIAIAFPVCVRSDTMSATGSGSTLIFVNASAGLLSTPSPLGVFPTAFAVFLISPTLISPSVMRYAALAAIDSPGAREMESPAILSLVSPFSPLPSPAHRPVRLSPPVPLPLQAMRAAPIVVPPHSKQCVPPVAVLSPLQAMRAVERYSAVRRDGAVRLCDFVPVAISFQLCSRSRFPSLLCRLLPS